MVRASNSNGLPSSHGQSYFGYTITSRRDTGTGYSALLTAYDNSNMWFTYNGNESNYATWRKLWHDGNDGSGSGLDADTVDGVQASSFLRSDTADTATGNITLGASTKLIFGNNTSYGIGAGGHNYKSGYFDTLESGVDSDPLELVYYRGSKVNIGPPSGRKTMNAGSFEISGTTVIDSGRSLTNINSITNTGGAKLEIQNQADGGTSRGIYMWDSTDSNWVIYMGQAGSGKSASGGTACSGLDGRTSHAIRYRVNDSTDQIGHLFENNSEEALFQIQGDTGNIFARGNVTAYASDKRLKTNIKTIENPIEKIKKIRGVEFDWLDNIEETHQFKPKFKRETGVIAQEIEKVIPDAISPAPFNNKYKTVEKDKIVALLIEAIKKQQEQIDELKEKLENK